MQSCCCCCWCSTISFRIFGHWQFFCALVGFSTYTHTLIRLATTLHTIEYWHRCKSWHCDVARTCEAYITFVCVHVSCVCVFDANIGSAHWLESRENWREKNVSFNFLSLILDYHYSCLSVSFFSFYHSLVVVYHVVVCVLLSKVHKKSFFELRNVILLAKSNRDLMWRAFNPKRDYIWFVCNRFRRDCVAFIITAEFKKVNIR